MLGFKRYYIFVQNNINNVILQECFNYQKYLFKDNKYIEYTIRINLINFYKILNKNINKNRY